MFIINDKKIDNWLKPEFIEEFEEYINNNGRTRAKSGYYYFNFENFLLKKKYIKNGGE